MTNGEKHIEKLLSWYKEAVTENGVCYLTCDDKNTLAYAIKCCKHFEDIKKDIDSWMLREESSSSEKPNKSEIPTGSTTKNCESCRHYGLHHEICNYCYKCSLWKEKEPTTKNDLGVDCISRQELLKIYEDRFSELQKLKHLKDNKGAEDRQMGVNYCINILKELPSVTPQEPRKGEWLRMSDLSEQEDDRYKCSRCGNVIHHKNEMNLYTFNSWCGRCGSDNCRHINYEVEE